MWYMHNYTFSNGHTKFSFDVREANTSIEIFPGDFKGLTKGRRFLSPDFAEKFLAYGASNQDYMIVSETQAALPSCKTVSVSGALITDKHLEAYCRHKLFSLGAVLVRWGWTAARCAGPDGQRTAHNRNAITCRGVRKVFPVESPYPILIVHWTTTLRVTLLHLILCQTMQWLFKITFFSPQVAEFTVGVEKHLHLEDLHSLKQMFSILITSAYRNEYLKYSDCCVHVAL